MVNTMIRLYHVDPGFDPKNLIAVEIAAPEAKYPEGRPVAAYFQRINATWRTSVFMYRASRHNSRHNGQH